MTAPGLRPFSAASLPSIAPLSGPMTTVQAAAAAGPLGPGAGRGAAAIGDDDQVMSVMATRAAALGAMRRRR